MKKHCLLLLAFFTIAGAAGAQTTITDSFLVDGIYRSFWLRIPSLIMQNTRPLVINMHGLGSNAVQQQLYTYFDPISDTAGFYLVMPQGTSNNGTPFWNVGFPGMPAVNDLKFISVLIDTLKARYPIDASRVYATGLSNGGYMSHLLALQLSDKIAAVASVAGTIVNANYPTVTPQRPMPVMEIHGDADGTVPYNGFAPYGIPIDTLMAAWVRWDGCSATPLKTSVPNTNISDGCTADKYVWGGGRNGTEVVLFRINGGGHTWPGAAFNIGVTNQDINASLEIWRFFRRWRLGGPAAGIPGIGKSSAAPWFSPNPASTILHIMRTEPGILSMTDAQGKRVLQSTAKVADLSGLASGMYFVQFQSSAGVFWGTLNRP